MSNPLYKNFHLNKLCEICLGSDEDERTKGNLSQGFFIPVTGRYRCDKHPPDDDMMYGADNKNGAYWFRWKSQYRKPQFRFAQLAIQIREWLECEEYRAENKVGAWPPDLEYPCDECQQQAKELMKEFIGINPEEDE